MESIVRRSLALALALALVASPITAAGRESSNEQQIEKLAQSSLEELMQIKVTTVAGIPQSRISSPAAVHVISSEDILRSGHRTIAEVLRMVPGMFVGRINSASWLVGSRGLTGSALTATRHLVLIDGRLVYDPLTSTAYWDTIDVVLSDIDRIEVIRGPGATLWGANAMNGVINIVTRESRDTVGSLVQLGTGDQDGPSASLRYGAALGDDSWYRVWAKYASHGDFEGPTGASLQDQWSTVRAGFRVDKFLDPATQLTLLGDLYNHPVAMASVRLPVPGLDRQFEQVTQNDDVGGASLLLRINHGFGMPSGWRLRAYYDQTERSTARYAVDRQTVDLDLRRWTDWGDGQDLMWGAEYLWTRDQVVSGPVLQFPDDGRAWYQFNAFVQNTSELSPDKWFLMLGSKFTYHSFSGFQWQPSLRLWWTPSENQTLWAAVSRPVRMPSRFEENGRLVFAYADAGAIGGGPANGLIVPLGVTGHESLRPEHMLAYELGHRVQSSSRWMLETSLFYNNYRRLIEPSPTILGPFTDAGSGRTYGAEFSVTGQVTQALRLEGSYSWLRTRIDGPVYQFEETSTPTHLAQLRSYLDIGENLELNSAVYYVSEVPQQGIESYTRMDLGIAWRPSPGTRLEVWGQNLLEAGHREASGASVPRSIYTQASFEFGQ